MAGQLFLIFKKDDIQKLMDQNPDKIVVRSLIEEGKLESGERVGVVRVFADAVLEGKVIDTIGGCPEPPCDPN